MRVLTDPCRVFARRREETKPMGSVSPNTTESSAILDVRSSGRELDNAKDLIPTFRSGISESHVP
jgi:hypothetical protein